jgi:hypothetical protein
MDGRTDGEHSAQDHGAEDHWARRMPWRLIAFASTFIAGLFAWDLNREGPLVAERIGRLAPALPGAIALVEAQELALEASPSPRRGRRAPSREEVDPSLLEINVVEEATYVEEEVFYDGAYDEPPPPKQVIVVVNKAEAPAAGPLGGDGYIPDRRYGPFHRRVMRPVPPQIPNDLSPRSGNLPSSPPRVAVRRGGASAGNPAGGGRVHRPRGGGERPSTPASAGKRPRVRRAGGSSPRGPGLLR